MNKDTKNIKHVWSVICQSSVVDQQSNNISLQNVLEQLQVNISQKSVQEFKQQNPSLGDMLPISFPVQIVSLWRSINPNVVPKADLQIEVYDGIGDLMQKAEFKFQFEEEKGRMRTILTIPTINITDTGLYLFKIKIKEEGEETFIEAGEIPFEVLVTKED